MRELPSQANVVRKPVRKVIPLTESGSSPFKTLMPSNPVPKVVSNKTTRNLLEIVAYRCKYFPGVSYIYMLSATIVQ